MPGTADDPVAYALEDGVAQIHFDDGKANALSHLALERLEAALDRAEKEEARAVIWTGRPGRFSAGFDLSVMSQGPKAATELALRGAELALRVYAFPAPVLAAVTGHALAMGAVLLCAFDERVGAAGSFKIGLNEVAIGMALPGFALEFARARLAPPQLERATALAEIYDPSGAVEAGYLDRVVEAEALEEAVRKRARQLADTLHPGAHQATKRDLRGETLERLRARIHRDRARLEG